MIKNIIIQTISALFIILWIYTGYNKIVEFAQFETQIGRSPFISEFSGIIAVMIPTGELLLAIMLIFNRTRLFGLYLSFILMAIFTGYIWLMLNYASDLPCSCGGVLTQMSWHDHLIFNAVFTLLGLIAILLHEKISKNPSTHRSILAHEK